MADIPNLAHEFMTMIRPALPLLAHARGQAIDGFFRQPGVKLYDWIAGKVRGTAAESTLEGAISAPEDPARLSALEEAITQMMREKAGFCEELSSLLKRLASESTQGSYVAISSQAGDHNKDAQIIGDSNTISIG